VEFFADRNLGRYDFAEYARRHGLTVHIHDDHFAPDEQDPEWIPAVAERGWIILSADKEIMRVPLELAAVMLSGAAFFNLVGGSARTMDHARNLVNTIHRIEAVVRETPPPYVAKLYRPSPLEAIQRGVPGSVRVVMDHPGWLASHRSQGFRPER
jgi:hypothetical protein